MDDAALVARACDGDAEALATLLERYRAPLAALASQILRDRDEALDVCQDAAIKAMRHIGELAEAAAFYGWIRGIVRNLALDRLRARGRGEARNQEAARRAAARPALEGADGEIYHEVLEAILSLPDEYHVPLFCRFVEEASYADIAIRAGKTTDSIRGLLYRGTKLLRKKLSHHVSG